ncbi:hypothetical protein PV733_33450 [Streptomyces europaeiscabiei]|uniref:hypothetical protein n=1 Tax=Streptomyces europaeiscabiei TaxID=146819 RepID=UPI0029A73F66|nr:hypothetical protein [Streptomyces europaeiscabiei]MDX3713768.1 hypothetical protein [Streptomyces europaeiscabiei]
MRRLRAFILTLFLAVDGLVFWASAAYDMANHPREQWVSAVLRLIIGVLNLAAAWKVHPYVGSQPPTNDPWAFPIVITAQVSAIPMILIPLWIEIGSPIHDAGDNVIFYSALAMFFFATVVIVFAFARHASMPRTWIALTALLPVAGVVQFWYLNFYKPSNDRPSVDVTASFKEVSHSRESTRLQGTITLKNVGSNSADVLGSMYMVTGHKMASAERMTANEASGFLDLYLPDRRHFAEHASLLRFDDVIRSGEVLSPGHKWTTSFVFDATWGRQDLVRLTVSLSLLTHLDHSKTSECEKGKFKVTEFQGSYRCVQTELSAHSLVRDILGDHPLARTVIFFPSGSESPHIETRYQSADRKFKNTEENYKAEQEDAQIIDSLVRDQTIETFTENRVDP